MNIYRKKIGYILFSILFASCYSMPSQSPHINDHIEIQTDISVPLQVSANKITINTDFVPVGIVFVTSTEVKDDLGNHTGSKITHEMFMREASKIQAHDIINIYIDVNIKRERKNIQNRSFMVTTYTYSGTGLAIKYSNTTLKIDTNRITDLNEIIVLPKDMIFSSDIRISPLIGKWILVDNSSAPVATVQSFNFFEDRTGIAFNPNGTKSNFLWDLNGERFNMTYQNNTSFSFKIDVTTTTLILHWENGGFAVWKKE